MTIRSVNPCKALALSTALALLLPLSAHAQTDGREQKLHQRVVQLEQRSMN